MTEAPKEAAPTSEEASTNFYWTFGNEQVFNLQTTVRGRLTYTQVSEHMSMVRSALEIVVKLGGKAKPVGQQPQSAPVAAPKPANGAPPMLGTTPQPGLVQPVIGEQSFPAEQLVGSITDGKPSWKVKGGRFTQFGVTIWPEALQEAGMSVEPGQAYSLAGYTAWYVSKPDGKPQKVVRLKL